MDSTLALGALRIARGAGGEAVREREPRRAGEASPKPPPKPRSGLCPELLADFRIPKPPGCSQGRRGQFSVQSDNRFSGRGGGVGSLPRAWRRVGVPARGTHDGKFLAKTTRKYISVLTEMPEIPKILPASIKNPRSPKILHLTGSWRHI